MDINVRKEKFKKDVIEAGGLLYTRRMLEDFSSYWCESDRGKKPKMRHEKEVTWEIPRRLSTWARRTHDYQCELTANQKSIQQKRRDFAISLEKYLDKYSRDMLNAFWLYYSQPENKPLPERLRWEGEEFWDLGTRLSQWASKNEVMANQGMRR